MAELDRWVAAASAELGIEPGQVDTKTVLDVARDVAHQVMRPGAPVTAYLLGLAVGRGADPAEAAARITALTQRWPSTDREPTEDRKHGKHGEPAAGIDPAGAAGTALDTRTAVNDPPVP